MSRSADGAQLDLNLRAEFIALFDRCLIAHRELESVITVKGTLRAERSLKLTALLQNQFEGIHALLSDNVAAYAEAARIFHRHKLFTHVFAQAVAGGSVYSAMLHQALVDLPLHRALKTYGSNLSKLIQAMPVGARLLKLDWGDGYARPPDAQMYMRGAAFEGSEYDLIYATHMLGHHETELDVARLFHFLSTGGTLVLGAYLPPGGANPHTLAHHMVLDSPGAARMVCKSPAELLRLTHALPARHFTASFLNEDFEEPHAAGAVLGLLCIRT